MPSPEELKAIQEEHMTEDKIKMSEEREVTLDEGARRQTENERAKEHKRIAEIINSENIVEGDRILISSKGGERPINAYFGSIEEGRLLYFVDKAPLSRQGEKSKNKSYIEYNQISTIYRNESK